MIRAAKLDVNLYEEVEADKTAMGQAMGVVVLSSLAAGIGSISMGGRNLILVTIAALVGWYIWAYLTYFIGTKFLPETQTKADHGELLRTIGFSSSPGLIRILGIIPGFTNLVFFGGRNLDAHCDGHCGASGIGLYKHPASGGCVLDRLDHSEHLCRALIVVCPGWRVVVRAEEGSHNTICLTASAPLHGVPFSIAKRRCTGCRRATTP